MFKTARTVTAGAAALALTAGAAITIAAPAPAEECVGTNDRVQITYDTAEVRMDSCQARDLVNAYGDVKDATGLATMFGAKWPQVSWLGGVFFAWAWNNEARIKECEVAHTGVTYSEINGIIVSCSPQS